MDRAAQSMNPYFAQESMDRAGIHGSRRNGICGSYVDRLVIFTNVKFNVENFQNYQSDAKRTCLIIVILWQLQAVMACSIAGLLFRRRRSVILFRGL